MLQTYLQGISFKTYYDLVSANSEKYKGRNVEKFKLLIRRSSLEILGEEAPNREEC